MKSKFKKIILLVAIIAILYAVIHSSGEFYRIDIVGSTSIQPIAEKLATEYLKNHSNLAINVQGGGSGLGVRSIEEKIASVGMVSANLSTNEEKNVSKLLLGIEGIVVCVNKANPMNDLSTEQLKNIFNGNINNWKEVGGSDSEIHVISREDGSGTRLSFESEVLNKTRLKTDAIIQSSTNAIEQAVAKDEKAIGYISYVYVGDDVKKLSIDGITISNNTIINNSYKLQSPFLFLIHNKEDKNVKDFLNWVFSPEGMKIIEQKKVIPVHGNELETIRSTVMNIPNS
ncbi:MAG: phosphate ABC transporter substrate-binding protein [Methanobrevibacter sp.]|jgi:phosphate transport system substrate-binding protein|nr:phosphate ABC transporter substrate-binding protein [Methanobrevibacter sp.]